MSETSRLFEEWAQKLAGTYLKDSRISVPATVNSVDHDKLTCEVTTIGDNASVTIPGVLLMAEVNDGFLVIPSVGSTVYIALTTRNLVFVEMFSEIDSILVSIPTGTANKWTTIFVDKTGIKLNNGTFGGLVEVVPLVSALVALQNRVNQLQTDYNGHFHTGVTPGVGSSGPTTIPVTGSPLTPSQRSDMENTTITHGTNA